MRYVRELSKLLLEPIERSAVSGAQHLERDGRVSRAVVRFEDHSEPALSQPATNDESLGPVERDVRFVFGHTHGW